MTPLRAKYIRDLARYYRRSPELISYEEVKGWLCHLIKERHQAASSVKHATRRAEVYSHSEVVDHFLGIGRRDYRALRGGGPALASGLGATSCG